MRPKTVLAAIGWPFLTSTVVSVLGESVCSHVDAGRPRHLDDAAGLHVVDACDHEAATCSDIESELEEGLAQVLIARQVGQYAQFNL